MSAEPDAAEAPAKPRRPRVDARGRRHATVSHLLRQHRVVPLLRLNGAWLADLGFDIGQEVEIEVEKGRLTLRAIGPEIHPATAASARAALRERYRGRPRPPRKREPTSPKSSSHDGT